MAEEIKYWFNTRTNQVEIGPQSLSIDRLGPFHSVAEASRALDIIRERAQKIREDEEQED